MKKEKDQIVFGIHAVTEALDAGKEMEKVLIKSAKGTSDIFSELRKRLIDEKIPFQHVPMEKLNSITRKNHQGVVAYISEISYAEIDFILPQVFEKGKIPLLLVLDQVSDVRNFGAIARTAECAGVDAIVVPYKGSARITSEALKTSAGALHSIPVCRHPDLKQLVNYLKSSGLQIFAAS
jgi:23S rRNA (guanosine2251-2'-O)-methyltransferase